MPMTEAQKKADKKYRDKCKPMTFTTIYKINDINEGQRLKAYLEQSGQSANSYIKELIKKDLDSKGFMMNE